MKKILIAGTTIIVGAAAIIAPYFIGTEAQKRFEHAHEVLQQEMVYPQFTAEAGPFQKGWFNSEASTQFTIQPSEEGAEPVTFKLVYHISQMPSLTEGALMSIDSELVLPDDVSEELKHYFNDTPLLSAHSIVKFNGTEYTTFSSPSYSGPLKDDEKTQLNWQGIEGTTTSDAEMRNISLSFTAPAFSLQDDEGKMVLDKLHYEAELHRGNHDLWFGTSSGSLEKLLFDLQTEKNGPTHMQVNNMDFSTEQKENGPLVDMNGKLTLASADFNGFKLENGIYDVGYNNLDGASLGRINESVKQLMREQPEDPSMLMMGIMPHFQTLLSQKPELSIRQLQVDTPMGNISGKVNVALIDKLQQGIMQNPQQLMDLMKLDIEASLPKPLVVGMISSNARSSVLQFAKAQNRELSAEELTQQVNMATQQQLQGMLAQKLIVEDDANYATAIHYAPHKLVINEQDATPMISGLLQAQ